MKAIGTFEGHDVRVAHWSHQFFLAFWVVEIPLSIEEGAVFCRMFLLSYTLGRWFIYINWFFLLYISIRSVFQTIEDPMHWYAFLKLMGGAHIHGLIFWWLHQLIAVEGLLEGFGRFSSSLRTKNCCKMRNLSRDHSRVIFPLNLISIYDWKSSWIPQPGMVHWKGRTEKSSPVFLDMAKKSLPQEDYSGILNSARVELLPLFSSRWCCCRWWSCW